MVIFRHLLVLELYLYDLEICRQIKCSFQGRCLRFKSYSCYSWTITVISDKKEYVLFSRMNPSSDNNTNVNITCYDTGTAQNTTTVLKNIGIKTSSPYKEMTNQERSDDVGVDDNNDNDGEDKEATKTENKENPNPACKKKCRQCRRCSGHQNDCPECSNVGILFITHVIAAGIGAGILYFMQFIREYRRKRTEEPKPESNEGMINASYGHTRGTDNLQMSTVSHQEEGIYSDVADNTHSIVFDKTTSNCSTGSALNDRKHSKLPDIPHDAERDEEYLLPQNPKDSLLSDTHTHSLKKLKTSTSGLQEELLLKDVNELNQETERDKILQDTFVADSGHADYFVLQKADDTCMNLK